MMKTAMQQLIDKLELKHKQAKTMIRKVPEHAKDHWKAKESEITSILTLAKNLLPIER